LVEPEPKKALLDLETKAGPSIQKAKDYLAPSEPTFKPVRTASCIALLSGDGKLLVNLRDPKISYGNLWVVPGGAIDDGESLEEGALRELYEECGIDFPDEKPEVEPIMMYETSSWKNDVMVSVMVIYYVIKIKDLSKNIKLKLQPTEVSKAAWISYTDI